MTTLVSVGRESIASSPLSFHCALARKYSLILSFFLFVLSTFHETSLLPFIRLIIEINCVSLARKAINPFPTFISCYKRPIIPVFLRAMTLVVKIQLRVCILDEILILCLTKPSHVAQLSVTVHHSITTITLYAPMMIRKQKTERFIVRVIMHRSRFIARFTRETGLDISFQIDLESRNFRELLKFPS